MKIASVRAALPAAALEPAGPLAPALQRALAERQARLIPAPQLAKALASTTPRLSPAALAGLEAALGRSERAFTRALGAEKLPSAAAAGVRAALDSMREATRQLSRPATFNAYYFFTNERGLYPTASALGPRGGAAVGVSGGLLDIAARTRADLVVSMDASESMKEFFDVVTTFLLAVDEQIRGGTLAAADRAAKVRELFSGPNGPGRSEELDQRAELLASFGFERARARELMGRIWSYVGVTNWLSSPEAPENVEHLTHLAREGRIVALSIDIRDEAYPGTLRRVLAAYGAPLATLNLSNLLDYTLDRSQVSKNLAQLVDVARSDAVVFNTAFGGARGFPREVRDLIGSFDKPGVAPFTRWADPNDLTAHYDRLYWGMNIA